MKKLFIILGFFVVMMGVSIGELTATTRFYRTTVEMLGELEQSFGTYSDSLDCRENIAAVERLERHWDGGRSLVLTFGNHTVMRNADEKMVALCEFARRNEYSDAMVSLKQAERYITDLMHDLYPSLRNLL